MNKMFNVDLKEIELESMGFAEGLLFGEAFPNSYCFKELDFDKLLEVIKRVISDLQSVEVGLGEDWDCTSGKVFECGEFVEDNYYFVASRWATPAVKLRFKSGLTYTFECWKEGDNEDGYFDKDKLKELDNND